MHRAHRTLGLVMGIVTILASGCARSEHEDQRSTLTADSAAPAESVAAEQQIDDLTLRNGVVNSNYPAVVRIVVTIDGSSYLCSGSLVTTQRVLTAAHCVRPFQTQIALGSGVTVTVYVKGVALPANVASSRVHEHYDEYGMGAIADPSFPGGIVAIGSIDLATIDLVNPVAGVTPLQLSVSSQTLVKKTVSRATEFVAVGYGKNETEALATATPRAGSVKVLGTLPMLSQDQLVYDGATIVTVRGTTGQVACQGDSGSPLLSGSTILGVTSVGPAGTCANNQEASYASVAPFVGWILGNTSGGVNSHSHLDVNRDGRLTILDALDTIAAIRKFGAGTATPGPLAGHLVDADMSGTINILDTLATISYIRASSLSQLMATPLVAFNSARTSVALASYLPPGEVIAAALQLSPLSVLPSGVQVVPGRKWFISGNNSQLATKSLFYMDVDGTFLAYKGEGETYPEVIYRFQPAAYKKATILLRVK